MLQHNEFDEVADACMMGVVTHLIKLARQIDENTLPDIGTAKMLRLIARALSDATTMETSENDHA
jgi:hypothetical protein